MRRTIHRVKGKGLVYEEPKKSRSRRNLALPTHLRCALIEHKSRQTGDRMFAGTDWEDEDLVFAQPNGRPIDKKVDYKNWCRLLREAGVRHVRLHDGRHTAATLLLAGGEHPRVVMELLGHTQIRTTMDIYSHVMPALAREAANRKDAILFGGQPAIEPPRTTTIDGEVQPIATKDGTRAHQDDVAEGPSPLEMGGAEGIRTLTPSMRTPCGVSRSSLTSLRILM